MIYPEPIVGAFILNEQGDLLLLQSPKWEDVFVVPGGHVELGETLVQALVREIKEETFLDIFDISFLSIDEYINKSNLDKIKHYVFINYLVKTNSVNIILNEEAIGYRWVKPANALEMNITESMHRVISKYLIK